MNYASLIAAGALRIYLTAFRSPQAAGGRAAYALSILQANFTGASPQILARFANAANEAALSGNAFNQAGDSYTPNLYNVPDFTGSQRANGGTGSPCLVVDFLASYDSGNGVNGAGGGYYRSQIAVPLGTTKGDISELAADQISGLLTRNLRGRDYLLGSSEPPAIEIERYYGVSVQLC